MLNTRVCFKSFYSNTYEQFLPLDDIKYKIISPET